MNEKEYLEAKHSCRVAWQRSLTGFNTLPADYQQILLDHFNMVWQGGLSHPPHWRGAKLPVGMVVEYNGLQLVQAIPIPYEHLCREDQEVFNEAEHVGKLYHD